MLWLIHSESGIYETSDDMWTMGFLIFISIILGVGAWLFFVWAVKSGQYDDMEGPKHRMLDDDDEDDVKK